MTVPITDYVNLSIATTQPGVTGQSLETPLLMGYHTRWTNERVREYSSVAGLEADGFVSTDPIHKMATALMAQDRKVERFKVGRRALPLEQAINLTPTSDVTTITVKVTIRYKGLEETYSLAGLGTGIPAMATALAGLINNGIFANGGTNPDYLIATPSTNDVQVRRGTGADTGQIVFFDDLAYCELEDVSADPGIATDLTAIRAEDDDWYCLLLDSNSEAELEALDSVVEAISPNFKICIAQTQDSSVADDDAGNIGETLHDASIARTALIYTPFSLDEYPACAWAGERLPYQPGSNTWMFKLLRGVTVVRSQLSTGQLSNLSGNGVNCFVYSAGRGDTRFGTMPDGSYIDDRHLLDYFAFRIPEEIMAVFRNPLRKVPYTDDAARIARGLIYKVCARVASWGAVDLSTFTFRSTTAAADQASADIAARIFRGLEFSILRTGATHKFYINGLLTDPSTVGA